MSGKALAAVIAYFSPTALDSVNVNNLDPYKLNTICVHAAAEHFGIRIQYTTACSLLFVSLVRLKYSHNSP